MLSPIFLIITFAFGYVLCDNPCQSLSTQLEIDECYMNMALEYGMERNPRAPYGTIIVDHIKNTISCIGVNDNRNDILLHGEAAAFSNCTQLYPSSTFDDLFNPGLNWNNQTLYTTGEPCPMCAVQIFYRNVKRVVWATSMKTAIKSGRRPQVTIDIHDVIHSAKELGRDLPEERFPIIEGGVLKDKCDHAFWCAFKDFRDEKYMKIMEENGELDYVLSQNEKFPCVTIPWHNRQ